MAYDERWHIVLAFISVFFLYCFRSTARQVLPLVLVTLPLVVFFLRRKRAKESESVPSCGTIQREVSNISEKTHEDHVRWSFLPSSGVLRTNTPKAIEAEANDFAKFRFLVLHRPTHNQALDKSGDWKYGWHFHKRKRLWEVRVQVQFKQKPEGPIWFGLEMTPGQAQAKSRQKDILLGLLRSALGGGFYQSTGDDINGAPQGAELEPGQFVMPLWALDQFHIAEPGQEPALEGDLNEIGYKRADRGVAAYKKQMQELEENLDLDKVYTFCFWGISQFIDVNLWNFKLSFAGKFDASILSGKPPIYVVAYDLRKGENGERQTKHLISQKDYFFKVALWSEKAAPEREHLQDVLGEYAADEAASARRSRLSSGNVGRLRPVMNALSRFVCCGESIPQRQRSKSA
jgi:hypothetical protein